MNTVRVKTTLPSTLAAIPAVRAATLSVFEKKAGTYLVPGRTSTYEVIVINNQAHCNCKAASFGLRCAHAIAALQHHERHTPTP